MTEKQRILVVDDEEAIRSALGTLLGWAGFDVEMASSGEQALAALDRQEPDLLILDVVLNEADSKAMSGLEVCRRVRQRERFIPILMLTSYPEWQVESLGQGAIAFVTKPWDNNALITQIRATLGAVQHIRREAIPDRADNSMIKAGQFEIDLAHFRVIGNGSPVDLTPIEFALLAFLARHPNRYWSREELLDQVWHADWVGFPRTVDRHIASLRRKLKLERNELIETVHGIGYQFTVD